MQLITIANQKGGVAKTTTANLLSIGLVHTKQKVLAIDCDPQTNLTFISGVMNPQATLYDIYKGTSTASEVITATKLGYDLIPGSEKLLAADKEFSGYTYLRNALQPIANNYDYIIMDTPPKLGTLLFNALATSNSVIVPMTANTLSVQGLTQVIESVNVVKNKPINEGGNPYVNIDGLLLTKYSDRANISRDIREGLEKFAETQGTKVFKSTIRSAVAIEEAQFYQADLLEYAPRSKVADDLRLFIKEYTGRKVK